LLFKGQPVKPQRALDHGFQFEYPDLKRALADLFR
jgi:NAD dependent epimerase/dehydratase family enzyme